MRFVTKYAALVLTAATMASPGHANLEMGLPNNKRPATPFSPAPAAPAPLPELPYRIDESCTFTVIVDGLSASNVSNDNSYYNLQNRILGYTQNASPPQCLNGKPQPLAAWRNGVTAPIGTYQGRPGGTFTLRMQRQPLLNLLQP